MTQNENVKKSEFLEKVLNQKVYFTDRQVNINTLSWNAHPTFKGVALKHLINANQTGNSINCHIVRIEPGCVLETHKHDTEIEIHEVVLGGGTMILDEKEINYSEGTICVIPANTFHKVVAGKDGMYLFAKFCPKM